MYPSSLNASPFPGSLSQIDFKILISRLKFDYIRFVFPHRCCINLCQAALIFNCPLIINGGREGRSRWEISLYVSFEVFELSNTFKMCVRSWKLSNFEQTWIKRRKFLKTKENRSWVCPKNNWSTLRIILWGPWRHLDHSTRDWRTKFSLRVRK